MSDNIKLGCFARIILFLHQSNATSFTCSVLEDPEGIRVLVAEELAHDDVRILSHELKVAPVELVLEPVLTIVTSALTDEREVLTYSGKMDRFTK